MYRVVQVELDEIPCLGPNVSRISNDANLNEKTSKLKELHIVAFRIFRDTVDARFEIEMDEMLNENLSRLVLSWG